MIANAVDVEAGVDGARTVLRRMRATGLCRISRPFRAGDAARVVMSHLGPGYVRGDAFETSGRLSTGAHLVVAGQMATRVLSGPEAVSCTACWIVGDGATLDLAPEPTLVCDAGSYVGRTDVALAPGARALLTDVVHREGGSALRATTTVRRGERIVLHDALRFACDDPDADAIGTFAAFGWPVTLDALDAVADACTGVRIGVGTLRDGDLFARVVGAHVWDVREALAALRACATRDSRVASGEERAVTSIQDIPVRRIDGSETRLADFAGDVLLVVNVASQCGLTPQYSGLQALYERFRDRRFAVLGFPANQFGAQEPGSNAEIAQFCETQFSVTFPMFEKIVVKGEGRHPLYDALTATPPAGDVQWNFEKFLVGRKGEIVARFAPKVAPDDPALVRAIEAELAKT